MDQNTNQDQDKLPITPEEASPSAPQTEPEATHKPMVDEHKSNVGILAALGIVVIVLLVAAYLFLSNGGSTDNTATENTGNVVAIVNGTEIGQASYDENYASIEQNALTQGVDPSNAETQELIKEQTLNGLVNNVLLIQGAEDAGLTISDDKVQIEYELLQKQVGGAELLESQMTQIGLTEEGLRNNIEEQLLINAYIESEVDLASITVSDEEVNEFVATLNTGDESELPPLEELRPQIEQQIVSQKQQERIMRFLDSLRDEAEIEILI